MTTSASLAAARIFSNSGHAQLAHHDPHTIATDASSLRLLHPVGKPTVAADPHMERMMLRMKSRVTFSIDENTLTYLTRRAALETGGNVSALLDKVVQSAALSESAKLHAAWYAARPDYAETAETERHAA